MKSNQSKAAGRRVICTRRPGYLPKVEPMDAETRCAANVARDLKSNEAAALRSIAKHGFARVLNVASAAKPRRRASICEGVTRNALEFLTITGATIDALAAKFLLAEQVISEGWHWNYRPTEFAREVLALLPLVDGRLFENA